MKILIILASLTAISNQKVCFTDQNDSRWYDFKVAHKKVYGSFREELLRYNTFLINLDMISAHNSRYESGLVSYRLEMNNFGDMSLKEFVKVYNGFKNASKHVQEDRIRFIPPAHVEIPDSVDWRKLGAVTPVKNQGHCGSCWSFSATGALEGQHFRKTNHLVSLSEQNLIDCCTMNYDNAGCDGGMPDGAFRYVQDNGGIDTEKYYPYEGNDNGICHYKPEYSGAKDIGFRGIDCGDEEHLKAAVATIGPISVAIDASADSFRFYADGVYDEPKCSSLNLDHAVLVVGYGTTKEGLDYWIVKNSWGNKWGKNGYIWMSRNKNNQCGIASDGLYPVV